jgi:hypothetical protein
MVGSGLEDLLVIPHQISGIPGPQQLQLELQLGEVRQDSGQHQLGPQSTLLAIAASTQPLIRSTVEDIVAAREGASLHPSSTRSQTWVADIEGLDAHLALHKIAWRPPPDG